MTRREKIMVYIMVIVVIIGVGVLLIRPAYTAYNESLMKYDDCLWEYQTTLVDMENDDILKEQYEAEVERYEENTLLGDELSGSETEKVILKQLESCGLIPSQTDVTDAQIVSIPIEEGDGEAVSEEEPDEYSDEEEGPTMISFLSGGLSVTVTGTMSGMKQFLNLCKGETLYYISSVSVSDAEICDYAVDDGREHTFYIAISYYAMKDYVYVPKPPEEESEEETAEE